MRRLAETCHESGPIERLLRMAGFLALLRNLVMILVESCRPLDGAVLPVFAS